MKFKKTLSIYEQIARSVQENIIVKTWHEGDRLPSVRDYAAEIMVNPNTVMRTYTVLQDQGLIENRRGIGFFVSTNAHKIATQMKKDQFAAEFLPEFFQTIEQLNIKWDELKAYYNNWKNQVHEN